MTKPDSSSGPKPTRPRTGDAKAKEGAELPPIDPQALLAAAMTALAGGLEIKHVPITEEERATKLRITEAEAEHERQEKAKAADHDRLEQAKTADHKRQMEWRAILIVTVASAAVSVPCAVVLLRAKTVAEVSWAPPILSTAFTSLIAFLAGRFTAPNNK